MVRRVSQTGPCRDFGLAETPSRRLSRRFGMAIEHGVWPLRTANVRARQLLGRRALTAYRLGEMSERCRPQARQYPAAVRLIGNAPNLRHDFFPRRRREPRHEPALTLALHQHLHWRTPVGWCNVEHALARSSAGFDRSCRLFGCLRAARRIMPAITS